MSRQLFNPDPYYQQGEHGACGRGLPTTIDIANRRQRISDMSCWHGDKMSREEVHGERLAPINEGPKARRSTTSSQIYRT